MKVIKATQQMLETRTLVLGFQGENLRTQLRIDCAATFAEYPNATPALAVKPSSGETYPVFVERDGNEVVWDIVANNLVLKGDGELQLTFYKDNVIAKTVIGTIRVNRSLQIDGEMPDVVATWIENANRKLAEVDAQIVELEGMVDTATDAATRAEQSASTSSTKAEQAAGSAATATAKANEATQAAGTATAKATEAEQSAQTATQKATAAADSERIATEKAGDATTAAGTATAKAEQATEAAQTATEKAGDASASATAAQTSATNAASSATAASASETAAKASETAASTSATQAAQSVLDAGANAQTAMQKAAEATQSATNAAASATSAATSAETASTKAGEAAQSAQAVAETAEQLAESLEQIDQNTQDIAELDERKANIDGYYPDMTVGNAEQLNSSKYVENSEPYTFRTSGGTSDIGNREYLDAVVGGTVAWNQAVRDSASENSTDFAPIVTVTDAVEDAAGVKVKIEPVQDLHGYDHPWPAGGGVNKLSTVSNPGSRTINGMTVQANDDGTFSLNGTTSGGSFDNSYTLNAEYVVQDGDYLHIHNTVANASSMILLQFTDNTQVSGYFSSSNYSRSLAEAVGKTVKGIRIYISVGVTLNGTISPEITNSTTSSQFSPYSNICPISGWDGVKVTRTGKNMIDPSELVYSVNSVFYGTQLPPDTNFVFSTDSTIDGLYILYSDADEMPSISSSEGWTSITYKYSVTSLGFTSGSHKWFKFMTYESGGIARDRLYQLELGSTASDFEPYAGQTYDITLPTEAGTVYGGTLDVSTGELVVDRAMVDLGTLNWVIQTNYSVNRFGAPVSDMTKATSAPYYKNIACSAYKPSNTPITTVDENGTIGRYNGWIYICEAQFSDVESFKAAMSGVQLVYELAEPITYTLTSTEIRTLLGTNNVWSDAGQTALTYTGTDEHLTLESGKKYLARLSGTDSMLLGSGQEITAAKGTDNVFDLTKMFGTAVADYVYGKGASFFRRWFPKPVYPYNAGELRHVEGLSAHEMVGFNQWNEEWENGIYNNQTGEPVVSVSNIRNKNAIRVFPNTQYFMDVPYSSTVSGFIAVLYYDANDSYTGNVSSLRSNGQVFLTPSNACYMRFYVSASYGTTYKHDICINLVHNGSRNGEYEPYEKHSYPLDSSVVLRGIPKVGANGVYWDGDRYLPDGTVERRYGVVDLGTQVWGNNTFNGISYFVTNNIIPDLKKPVDSNDDNNFLCTKYPLVKTPGVSTAFTDKTFFVFTSGYIYVRDDSFTDLASFKSAMQGVLLVYELATPTTETAQPYHSTQWVSDWGTEEFVSTSIVPVGSETRYPANLRDKLQHLPDAASGNGSYLITQTDGQMALTPFPAPPSTAGNYVLKATVTGGVATYTWEVAT